MKNKALGLIETYGYIGAIEAADTAVKAAYVELSAVEKVKGGLVTVQLLGDVGAVKAAVDAGVQKCKALGVYVSSHVIARPDSELYKIVPKLNSEEADKPKEIIAFKDENAKEDELKNIQKNTNFYKNHPSIEHFLPMFIAFGNAINKKGKSFNSEMLYSNISMESFIFDKELTC